MIHEQTIKIITCDFCKKRINEDRLFDNSKTMIVGYVGQGTDQHAMTINLKITGVIPYSTGAADICEDCAIKYIDKIIRAIRAPKKEEANK